jgi:hypothetical protein
MRLINVDYDKVIAVNKPMVIYAFSDTHMGNVGFDEKLLKKHIEACRKEDAYWVHLGDWCEAIGPKDKRFDVRVTSNPVLDQYLAIEELFRPIKDRGIAILSGNHDEKIAKDYGDFVGMLSRNLGVPYLGYGGFVNLRLCNTKKRLDTKSPQKQAIMFIHHGLGAGKMLGSKGNNLQKLSGKFSADIYAVGHVHTYMSHVDSVLGLRTNHKNILKFHNSKRFYFSCPAYFNAYEEQDVPNYVEKVALQPQTTGCVRIEVSIKLIDGNWELDVKMQPLLK